MILWRLKSRIQRALIFESICIQRLPGTFGISSRTLAMEEGGKDLALYLQSLISVVYGVDIHPAAVIGKGILPIMQQVLLPVRRL